MDQTIYMQLLLADPVATLKTGLRFVHFIGLALGLGAATLLDLLLLRFFIRENISRELWGIFHFSTKVVNVGLLILWATGIGFIVHYALFDPVKLTNGKIWAKLAIVMVLTVNGAFIHSFILPRLRAQVGRTLFCGMTPTQKIAFQISGAISVTSWYIPVVLGAFPQLNFTVPLTTILISYLILMALVALGMHALLGMIDRAQQRRSAATTYAAGLNFT
jgi:hypothetical protein